MSNWGTHETKMVEAQEKDKDRIAKLNAMFQRVSEMKSSTLFGEVSNNPRSGKHYQSTVEENES